MDVPECPFVAPSARESVAEPNPGACRTFRRSTCGVTLAATTSPTAPGPGLLDRACQLGENRCQLGDVVRGGKAESRPVEAATVIRPGAKGPVQPAPHHPALDRRGSSVALEMEGEHRTGPYRLGGFDPDPRCVQIEKNKLEPGGAGSPIKNLEPPAASRLGCRPRCQSRRARSGMWSTGVHGEFYRSSL